MSKKNMKKYNLIEDKKIPEKEKNNILITLLNEGIPSDTKDKLGNNIIHHLIYIAEDKRLKGENPAEYYRMIQILIKHNPILLKVRNNEDMEPLNIATELGNTDLVRVLLDIYSELG